MNYIIHFEGIWESARRGFHILPRSRYFPRPSPTALSPVCQLPPHCKQLKPLYDSLLRPMGLSERRNLLGVVCDKSRLDKCGLAALFEAFIEDVTDRLQGVNIGHPGLPCLLLCDGEGIWVPVKGAEVETYLLEHYVIHGNPSPGPLEADSVVAVREGLRAVKLVDDVGDHILREFHHILIVGISLVKFNRGELRVVPGGDSLVPKDSPDLVDSVEASDDEALQVQLRRDPKGEG